MQKMAEQIRFEFYVVFTMIINKHVIAVEKPKQILKLLFPGNSKR